MAGEVEEAVGGAGVGEGGGDLGAGRGGGGGGEVGGDVDYGEGGGVGGIGHFGVGRLDGWWLV